MPRGVANAKRQKVSQTCPRAIVLRTIFSANAKAAVDLCNMIATKIKIAVSVGLTPKAVPRKKDGMAIMIVIIKGIDAGESSLGSIRACC